MAFNPVRDGRGQPKVTCICDDCGREEVVAAVHGKRGADGHGQAVSKIQNMGWSYIGKRLRCVSCEASRKVVNMADKKAARAKTKDVPRQPTRAQKREIMDLLDECYDTEAECYRGHDTDDTLADVLEVMPGWVAQLREEFFGPAGSNEEMAALAEEVRGFLKDAGAHVKRLEKEVDDAKDVIIRAEALLMRLGKIEQAVGPRALAKAK